MYNPVLTFGLPGLETGTTRDAFHAREKCCTFSGKGSSPSRSLLTCPASTGTIFRATVVTALDLEEEVHDIRLLHLVAPVSECLACGSLAFDTTSMDCHCTAGLGNPCIQIFCAKFQHILVYFVSKLDNFLFHCQVSSSLVLFS